MNHVEFCTEHTLRCEDNPYSEHYNYSQKGNNTPLCCATHIIELLFFTTSLLEENHISYFITWGTQLGAIRHGGLIPWDTDGDIGILAEDYPRVKALKSEIQKRGFWLADFGFEGKGLTIFYSHTNHLHLDIELWEQTGESRTWSNYKILESDLKPLKRYSFYDRQLFGVNCIDYLIDYYGSDCLSHSCKKNCPFDREQNRLISDFSPALIDINHNFESHSSVTLLENFHQHILARRKRLGYFIYRFKLLDRLILIGRRILPATVRHKLWEVIGVKLYQFLKLS